LNREGFTTEKKTDSKLIKSKYVTAGFLAVVFSIMGMINLMTEKNNYWVFFGVGGLSLAYLFFLLKKTKENKRERYEDERSKFIEDKSLSMSFQILLVVILILKFMIERNYIMIDSSFLIDIIFGIVVLVKFGSYLFCKYKY
jgi:hypothetical protein